MNNYEYIIACLPVLGEGRLSEGCASCIEGIREQLDERDRKTLDFVLGCYAPEGANGDFYTAALASRNAFIREYFRFDLNVRNTKTEFLNSALERPEGTDIVILEGNDGEFDEKAEVDAILSQKDIMARERGLDDIMWKKAEELTVLHVFDFDVILAFVVRLKIIERWELLDEQTGREMFRKLVEELRNNR